MQTVVSLANLTSSSFFITPYFFSEISEEAQKFWKPKFEGSVIRRDDNIELGKLSHPIYLTNGCNIIVSLILSFDFEESGLGKDNIISLKLKIKGTTSGCKVYSYASSFPERTALTDPFWKKGAEKNSFFCRFSGTVFQIRHSISWNDNVCFSIESRKELPVLLKRLHQKSESRVSEYFYENQWKAFGFGRGKYSHKGIHMGDNRPHFSTSTGIHVIPFAEWMPPTSSWTWKDEWHVDKSLGDYEGWIYLNDWLSSEEGIKNASKMRCRRWKRTREKLTEEKVLHHELYHVVRPKISHTLSDVEGILTPLLRELKQQILASPGDFDFRTINAIPSPRLRRFLKNL